MKETKLRVYNIPTILYASESWTLQKRYNRKINAIERKHLRKKDGKTKKGRIGIIEAIRETLKQEPIKNKKGQLKLYGQLMRMESRRIPRKVHEAQNIIKRTKSKSTEKIEATNIRGRKYKKNNN